MSEQLFNETEFKALTKRLQEAQFVASRFSDTEVENFRLARPKGLYHWRRSWVIKRYLAGEQRIFGYWPDARFSDALRVNDMLTIGLAAVKQRNRNPSGSDFNTSEFVARDDWATEMYIKGIILGIVNLVPKAPTGRPTQRQARINRLAAIEAKLDTLLNMVEELITPTSQKSATTVAREFSQLINAKCDSVQPSGVSGISEAAKLFSLK